MIFEEGNISFFFENDEYVRWETITLPMNRFHAIRYLNHKFYHDNYNQYSNVEKSYARLVSRRLGILLNLLQHEKIKSIIAARMPLNEQLELMSYWELGQ